MEDPAKDPVAENAGEDTPSVEAPNAEDGEARSESERAFDDGLDDRRREVLDHALAEAAFDGWSEESFQTSLGAANADASEGLLLFPRGLHDLVDFYSRECDERMLAALEDADLASMKIRDKVTFAIRTRIECLGEHKEAARRAGAWLSRPPNAPAMTRLVYRTVDAVWRGIGDGSTDFNFYSKRAILAGVYLSTLSVWMSDHSEDAEKTWRFLDDRIANVMTFEKFKAKWRETPLSRLDPLSVLSRLRYGMRS